MFNRLFDVAERRQRSPASQRRRRSRGIPARLQFFVVKIQRQKMIPLE